MANLPLVITASLKNNYFYVHECFPACMFVQNVCLVPMEVEEGVESLGTRIIGGCKPPSGCWSQNMAPLQE